MTASDDKILEFLAESGKAHNVSGIEANMNHEGDSISYNTVLNRTTKLEEAGLLTLIPAEGNYYKITEKGIAYLEGDLDGSEIDL